MAKGLRYDNNYLIGGPAGVKVTPNFKLSEYAGADGRVRIHRELVSSVQVLRNALGASVEIAGAPLRGHWDPVSSVSISPDGTRIVSGSGDFTLRLWDAPKVWPDELCKKLTRNMSHKQWREWVSPEIDYVVQCPGLPIPPDEPDNLKEKS